MGILIAGHPRSGTSMLRRVLDSHPDIEITREFGCYQYLNIPLRDHRRMILRRFLDRRNNRFTGSSKHTEKKVKGVHFAKNIPFVLHYLADLNRQGADPVTAVAITNALRSALSGSMYAGDKYPDYCFQLDRLACEPDLQTILIVRDPRDLASSVLVKARGVWKNNWSPELRDVQEVAWRWVSIIDSWERNEDRVQVVFYEQLVTDPWPILKNLAIFLGVDEEEFDYSFVNSNSIGKYKHGLTPLELDDVLAVAGERMRAIGYETD